MNKTFKRWISLLLVIVFCFQLMLLNAMAADLDSGNPIVSEEEPMEETVEEQDPPNISQEVAEDKIAILYEEEELREEYIKQFNLENTNMMAVVYPYSVHYEENGQWVEIDNHLKEDAVQYRIPAHEGRPTEEFISEEQGGGTRQVEDPEKAPEMPATTEASETSAIPEEPTVTPEPTTEPIEEPEQEPIEEALEEPVEGPVQEPVATDEGSSEDTFEEPVDEDIVSNGLPNPEETVLAANTAPTVEEEPSAEPDAGNASFEDAAESAEAESEAPTEEAPEETVAEEEPTAELPAEEELEPTPEPELKPEPAVDPTPELTPGPTAEPTLEPTPEPVSEVPESPAPSDEPVQTATPEPTPDPEDEKEDEEDVDYSEKTEVSDEVLRNIANDFSVFLPKILSEEKRAGVSYKGYTIYFRPDGISESRAVIEETKLPDGENNRKMAVNNESSVTYPTVYKGIDLNYQLLGQELKERYILQSMESAIEEISTTISAPELSPKLYENGNIEFMDKNGEIIFCIPEPYLYDANGLNGGVSVSLYALNTGDYRLVYSPDPEWLGSGDRAWPVVLDPTISKTLALSSFEDSYVTSASPTTSFPSTINLIVGNAGVSGICRAYLRMNDLPSLKSSDVVISAWLSFYAEVSSSMTQGITSQVFVVNKSTTVDYSTITWNNQPAHEEDALDQKINSNNLFGYNNFDITRAVRKWYSGMTNNGLVFMSTDEDTYAWYYYYAKENPGNDRYPRLTIVYANTTGIEDYWDYTTQDLGRAGTIRVHDYSGNLILSRTDLSYGGNLPGAPVVFHYNLATRSTNLGYGYGWRNSFTQTIESKTISSVDYYKWIDGDGTQKYFKKTDGVWKDESGLGYTLKITASATGTSDKYTITDKKKNKLIFDAYGRLTSVKDSSSNIIAITYKANSSDNLRISTVTDAAGRVYKYTYSSGTTGDLTTVAFRGTGSTNLETVTYTYTDSQPTQVTYADGNSVLYTWTSHRLNSAQDILMADSTRDRINITRVGGTPLRTGSLTYLSHGNTVSSLSFEYGDNTTKVTDALGRYVIYQFNNFGNTKAVYNSEGQALYGRYAQDSNESNRANQLLGSSRLQDTVVGNDTYTIHVGANNETIHLVTRENLLQNGDITQAISGTWTGTNTTSSDKRVTAANAAGETRGNLDNYALRIIGSPKKSKRFTQTVSVSGTTGDIFTFGGWAKCSTVSLSSQTKEGLTDYPRRAGLWVELYNGSTKVCGKYVAVNEDVHYWQFLSGSIKATGAYDTVKFHFRYENNANTAYFDGAQLFKETFEYLYKYDSDGNLTSVTDPAGNKTTYTYVDGTGDISKIELPDGNEFNYNYNSKHLLTQSISALGVTTDYTYDSAGNSTSASIHPQSGGRNIKSNTTYTTDKNMTASVTGGDRNTVTYSNNTEKSLVNSITDAKNNVTSYSYDSMRRRIQALAPNGGSVDSTYTDDLLTGVSHSNSSSVSTDYGFTYGIANLPTAVKIGNNWTLVNKSYNTGTWTLAQQAFGNSDYWKYTYDPGTDELLSRFTNAGIGYEYVYNTKGQLARVLQKAVTIVGGEVTASTLLNSENYLYDAFDRLVRIINADSGDNLIADVCWTYDQNENITSVTTRIMENGTLRTQTYSYTYNDDKQPTSSAYGNVTENIAYDAYGRTASRTVKNNNSTVLSASYGYRDIGTNYTSTQVYGLDNTYGNTMDSHIYTYDANGNIVSDSDGTDAVTYVYDSLNQLVWEKNEAAGKAWQYAYDLGGNILSKTEYDYDPVTDQTSNPVTVNYVYGDTEWHDLLTSYNNQTITYDGMGNPLSYRGWTMTWQGGRQLAAMTNGTDTLSFGYNEGGLRTAKTVGNTTRSYIWNSSRLLVDRGVDDTLYFHYNANGEMIGYTRKTASGETECFLVKNQQGDVEKVIAADGTVLAAYTYDAWGNILSSTGTLASVNPIRYRGYYFDTETGLYYLHSRYYDPNTGRFINSDIFTNTDQGIIGTSMFVYGLNNPAIYFDYNGFYAVYVGGGVDLAAGAKIGGFAGVVFDDKGNSGIIVSTSIGGGTPAASASCSIGVTDADTIFDMEGIGFSIGGSYNAGADFTFGTSRASNTVTGFQVSPLGIGTTNFVPELHGEITYTVIISYKNLPPEMKSLVDRVLSEQNTLLDQVLAIY